MTQDLASHDLDFIRTIIANDQKSGKHGGRLATRFPPEPNGFLHIGHAKSICLNFGVAQEYGGTCNLRFDDTNPEKESQVYIDAIQTDVRWLGFQWQDRVLYTSDYFEQLYQYALVLIQKGLAYVCDLNAEQMRQYRGTLTQPGQDSPFRYRDCAENMNLFQRMRAGEFAEGSRVLRAKIDMSSPNMNMRDPTLYRIRQVAHHQTGRSWPIYPTYDFSHPLSDALEGITHSLCTLEFEDHRPLYDWLIHALSPLAQPRQIEFSRLELEYTLMSKRKLNQLVSSGVVSGWDDPRMPTIAGLRRRGYTPESIREFCARIGITKSLGMVEMALLEGSLRDHLESTAPRALAVLQPLRVVIDTLPEGYLEEISAPLHPQNPQMGSRMLPFTRELYIEQEDFCENPPKQFKRLVPGEEVRLRHGYVIRCEQVIKDPQSGAILELRCSHDPSTLGMNPQGRKVKGVIHWVSATQHATADIHLYEPLFTQANPEAAGGEFTDHLNPQSLTILPNCPVEFSLAQATLGSRYQFERLGYFYLDPVVSRAGERFIFNRSVSLRDTWAKIENRQRA
ncbi:MAG: glutamine--tRNA ligase/YqeY domain fusion protein [Magnetococcus sp. DMHC-6]